MVGFVRGMLSEFKTFAMRGNVIDMAVGIVIGVAFGQIVNSLVADIINPPIGWLTGGMDFTDLQLVLQEEDPVQKVAAVTIGYGKFITAIINFVIVAFALFLLVKVMNVAKRKEQAAPAAPAAPPAPTKDQELLAEIRDILRSKA